MGSSDDVEIELERTGNVHLDDILWAIAQKIMKRGEHKSQGAINADVARSSVFICFYADEKAAKWIAIKGATLLEKLDIAKLSAVSGMIVPDIQSAEFVNKTLGDGDAPH